MYTKESLMYISQLELLYKSCLYTLREQNFEVSTKHENLFNTIPDHDTVDLLDTIEILYDLLTLKEEYKEIKTIDELTSYAKRYLNLVESLDTLEELLNFTELEIEMGAEILTSDTLDGLMIELNEENDINSIDELNDYINGSKEWKLKLYYAKYDQQYVAVFC